MGVKVPTQDNLRTSISGTMPTFRDPGFQRLASLQGKQDQELGDVIQKVGDTGAKIAIDVQKEANEVRVNEAINKMRERAMKLAYDPKEGYLNLKGNAALERPDGVALPEEYGGKLNTSVSEIAAGLANEEQRRIFQLRANDFETSFKGEVQTHLLKEFQGYQSSVADGNFKLSVQDAELNWNSPDKIDAAINGVEDPESGERYGGVRQSVYQKAKATGMSAVETEAAMNEAESSVHAMVIQSAITNGNVTYANDYLAKNKSRMTADDILKVNGQVNQKMDAFTAINATQSTAAEYTDAFNPTDMDRLTNIVLANESNNQRYDKDGKVLTSSAGAKGEMQVMDGTNKDPGFGVEPAKDDSLDERARVGRDYLAAMVKRYGDASKALAAYNAGPDTVDKAMKAATEAGNPSDWMSHLKEFQSAENNAQTLDYVEKGMKKFGAGVGSSKLPSEAEFVSAAVAKLGEAPRLEAIEATRTQAAAQYKLMVDAKKQRGEVALANAQQELIANGGNFNQLQPATISDLSRYDPDKYDEAMKFAKAISNDNVTTNLEAYSLATQHPNELAAMSEATFQQFLVTNFDKGDREKIVSLRSSYVTGSADDSPKAINNDLLNSAVNTRLKSIGINPSPKADETEQNQRIGAIQKFIRDDIYKQQEALGRKLAPKELEERIDVLFGQSVELPGVLWGTSQSKLVTMTFDDIPNPMRVALRNEFKARGVTNPTDDDILQAYWRYNSKGKTDGG